MVVGLSGCRNGLEINESQWIGPAKVDSIIYCMCVCVFIYFFFVCVSASIFMHTVHDHLTRVYAACPTPAILVDQTKLNAFIQGSCLLSALLMEK